VVGLQDEPEDGQPRQSILSRIEAVDALITPALQQNVREGHPEVTFAFLNN
jgi:predicted RNase H-like nuclease